MGMGYVWESYYLPAGDPTPHLGCIMHIEFLPPARASRPYVKGYLYTEDLTGHYAGQTLVTCPEPTAVLAINFAKGALDEAGRPHPGVSLLGLQERSRSWRPQDESLFVAAFLTPPGLATLFPSTGPLTANALRALDDIVEAESVRGLRAAVAAGLEVSPRAAKEAFELWLAARLEAAAQHESPLLPGLLETLFANRSVARTCAETGFEPRTLLRRFKRHVGLSPGMLLNLERLRASVAAVQRSKDAGPAGTEGYSDQSHQIRSWTRHLERSPKRYMRTGISAPARVMVGSAANRTDPAVFWL